MSLAILTDVTRCIGCEACVEACKQTNQTGEDLPWRWQKNIDDLSASRWTTVLRRPGGHFIRQHCRHCLEPACVSACPVGALHKTPEGPVVYDATICMGCRYCMMSCPFGIPRYAWAEPVPTVRKCVMCHDLIESGKLSEPACTKACPNQATVSGERDALLAEARRRIQAEPKKYLDRIWGEREVGGTGVLYISDIPLDFLGWQKDLPEAALPDRVQATLHKVPAIFAGVGAGMLGLWWVIERRERLARAAGRGPDDGKPEGE